MKAKTKAFRLSPLKARVFRLCRLRYRYQYVDRLPPRLRLQDTFGTCLHNTLSAFYRLPPNERDKARLLEIFEAKWSALSPRYRLLPGAEDLHRRGHDLLSQFAAAHDLHAKPFLLEPYLEVHIAPDILLVGRPDRVDEEGDYLHIIDYKTGEPPQEVDAVQLRFYAIMVQEGLARRVGRVSFWYLDGGRLWTALIRPEDLALAQEEALTLATEIRQEVIFPASVGPHCAHCPFLSMCQYRDEIAQRRQAEGW